MTTPFNHLTDAELLRVAEGQAGLIKALAERLEIRIRDIEDIGSENDRTLYPPNADPTQGVLF